MRVHELARELGITHHALLDLLERAPRDIPADSMMSHLMEADIAYLRDIHEHGLPEPSEPQEWVHPPSPIPQGAVSPTPDIARPDALEIHRDIAARWARGATPARHGFVPPPQPRQRAPGFPDASLDVAVHRALGRREEAVARFLHEYRALGDFVRPFVVSFQPMGCDEGFSRRCHAADPVTLDALLSDVLSLYTSPIDWERLLGWGAPRLGGFAPGWTRASVRENWTHRDRTRALARERAHEYEEGSAPLLLSWMKEPSRIDPALAAREGLTDYIANACLAHELTLAEDVVVEPMLEHLFAGASTVTRVELNENTENTRELFVLWVGATEVVATVEFFHL